MLPFLSSSQLIKQIARILGRTYSWAIVKLRGHRGGGELEGKIGKFPVCPQSLRILIRACECFARVYANAKSDRKSMPEVRVSPAFNPAVRRPRFPACLLIFLSKHDPRSRNDQPRAKWESLLCESEAERPALLDRRQFRETASGLSIQ